MPGYSKFCRYCDELVPPDATVCPSCGKENPTGSLRCPKCRSPIRPGWSRCLTCGLDLEIDCPECGERTFFGDYCEACDARLVVVCPHCETEQPPVGDTCVECGKPLTATA